MMLQKRQQELNRVAWRMLQQAAREIHQRRLAEDPLYQMRHWYERQLTVMGWVITALVALLLWAAWS